MTNGKLNMGTDAARDLGMRLQDVKNSMDRLKKVLAENPPPAYVKVHQQLAEKIEKDTHHAQQ